MSEDPAFYRGSQSTTDGVWSARYAIDDEKRGRLALVIEHANAEGQHILTIPLDAGRARELRWLLTQMLIDAGEEAGELGDWAPGQNADGSWTLDRGHDRPIYSGRKPPKR